MSYALALCPYSFPPKSEANWRQLLLTHPSQKFPKCCWVFSSLGRCFLCNNFCKVLLWNTAADFMAADTATLNHRKTTNTHKLSLFHEKQNLFFCKMEYHFLPQMFLLQTALICRSDRVSWARWDEHRLTPENPQKCNKLFSGKKEKRRGTENKRRHTPPLSFQLWPRATDHRTW